VQYDSAALILPTPKGGEVLTHFRMCVIYKHMDARL
jgi:hypothetical protein